MRQRYGRIINMSSIVVSRQPGQANYCASRRVHRPDQVLAKELAARNTANAVAPGFIDTDMTATV